MRQAFTDIPEDEIDTEVANALDEVRSERAAQVKRDQGDQGRPA